ncbi:GrpB-like predicted nucleotidyltransferase (UPF0157 family) [Paenibacillus taihuensis]|uniref:GrpB-like predicted nucleotidyltransferase (UPF0157 family) n=1 Tax=Paenibacillus taihuensis TaxID=1156355 RepID=A0A3D9S0B9_9BACL|nr:GrpB family protein [Paenibacillus taihuensis]REE85168.1 GrpB-like predicted nucleotidyltransferase (UPF0157 family) [Paenibacillus taihuensis]
MRLLEIIVSRLRSVPGIEGIVLGGSRARGTHTGSSDIDIGIYYDPDHPVDTQALAAFAAELDDLGRNDIITPIGEWGPWINGGGWLQIRSLPVDLLYRDLEQVKTVVEDCLQGRLSVHYQPGHPHAFCSAIYMGEAAICKPLWDPNGRIQALKALCATYPDALRDAVMAKFMWEADFSAGNARKGISRSDVSYVAGHLFRAVSCLTQVLFAINRTYLLNEKGAVAACAAFPSTPDGFEERVRRCYALLSQVSSPGAAVDELQALISDTERLIAETSKPNNAEETDVSVLPFDSNWSVLFKEEAHRLRQAISDIVIAIEHFGSTSVDGLDAKPIVDILVGTQAEDRLKEVHIETLAKLNYEFLGEDGRRPGRFFFRKRGSSNFNLSFVPFDGDLWRDNLILRDYLRTHPDEVSRYAATKKAAAEASPNSLLGYQNRKRAFVEEMKERARVWQSNH